MSSKKDYLSYHEIHGQYRSLRQTLDYMQSMSEAVRAFFEPGRDVVFVASGSSYWMSLSAHLTLRRKTGKRTAAIKAGDIVLCPDEFVPGFSNPILICPSRSGRTSEVLLAIGHMRAAYPDLKVLSLVEYDQSPLEDVSDLTLRMPWANEASVCQTQSFSNLYLAAVLLAGILADDRSLFDAAAQYLAAAPALYARHEAMIARIVTGDKPKSMVSLGCGLQYGVCIEGAYIVTEMAEFSTNYYQLLEYRHGPIVTADAGTFIFILSAPGSEAYEQKIARDAERAGAVVCVFSGMPADYGKYGFSIGSDVPKEVVALHYVFCMQSIAFHFSVGRGKNPDQPGSLVPFIEL